MKKLVRTICIFLMLLSLCCTAYAATYRSNSVEFTAANGLTIANGAFTLKSYSITSGQDPNGKNYVGKVYPLSNGEFTFSVGRSGSNAVANWFNGRLSSYNDTSVNGDRTTFDHTAEKLNFAFIGDLSLTVTTNGGTQPLEVLFSDVALAQGSTGFSNNWWFGQTIGQHTRDSDGDNTVLTIGEDSNGNTVYASFLRGGNDTNEITLEHIAVVDDARDTAVSAVNVISQFSALPINGTVANINGFPGSYDPTSNHIQGYSQYIDSESNQYAILTHSVSTANYAHIVAGPKAGSQKWGFKTYLKNWAHPGGIQTIGDYLLVPNESNADAHINLYDLRSLAVGELRRVENFDLHVNHKAGAIAITSYEDANGNEYYLLVIAHLDGANSVYHVYRATASNGIELANFVEVGSIQLEKDFQGFGLITEETTNDIYLIGLWSPSEGATFADYAYLYQLDKQTWALGNEIEQLHLTSSGGAVGMLGVHFRYGASAFLNDEGLLVLSAAERNSILGSALATNDWISLAE